MSDKQENSDWLPHHNCSSAELRLGWRQPEHALATKMGLAREDLFLAGKWEVVFFYQLLGIGYLVQPATFLQLPEDPEQQVWEPQRPETSLTNHPAPSVTWGGCTGMTFSLCFQEIIKIKAHPTASNRIPSLWTILLAMTRWITNTDFAIFHYIPVVAPAWGSFATTLPTRSVTSLPSTCDLWAEVWTNVQHWGE